MFYNGKLKVYHEDNYNIYMHFIDDSSDLDYCKQLASSEHTFKWECDK